MPTTGATDAFRRQMGRNPQRLPLAHGIPIRTPKPLEQAALYHYWHPDRDGVESCPTHFATRLADFHRDLAICRPPGQAPTISRPWLVWYRKSSVTHHLSPGWVLLFCWQTPPPELTPLPLDERVFANLYTISAQAFGGAVNYFESVVAKMKADKVRIQDIDRANMEDRKRDFMQSRKIKNIGRGNKFAMHHDGSVVPSRGEANWQRERELSALPKEHADRLKDRRARLQSARKQLG